MSLACLSIAPRFKPGDPPPSGYVAWFEWAKAQQRGGLRQWQCQVCGKWLFPQEVAGHNCERVPVVTEKPKRDVDAGVVAMGIAVAGKVALRMGIDREDFHKLADSAYDAAMRDRERQP